MIPSGLGIGVPHQCYEDYGMNLDAILHILNPSWWYTWKYDQLDRPGYVPMVWRCTALVKASVPTFFYLLFGK